VKFLLPLITCYRIQVAFVSVVVSALVLFDVSPEKQAEARELIMGIFALAGVLIAAHGYAVGQSSASTITPPPDSPLPISGAGQMAGGPITTTPLASLSLNTPTNPSDATANHPIVTSLSQ
jgi:hypothetical protein